MIFSIASQKGGVGKTSSCISLSAGIARKGKKVLLIDIDSQANSSKVLLPHYPDLQKHQTIFTTILDRNRLPIHNTHVPNLDIVPSHILLSNTDVELTTALDHREERLKRELELIKQNYDYIFIDCPPTLSWLTINAMTASDKVIVIVSPGYFELDSIGQIGNTIKKVKTYFNPNIELSGFLFTMSDPTVNSKTSLQILRQTYTGAVFNTVISRNTALRDAHFEKKDIFSFNPNSTSAQAYEKLIITPATAWPTRMRPLDVATDISRFSARQPATRTREMPDHIAHRHPRKSAKEGTGTHSETTPVRLARSNPDRNPHPRRVVALHQFDSRHKDEPRADIMRPDTGTYTQTSGPASGREAPQHPDNTTASEEPPERPLRGVRQDKDRNSCDRAASTQPAAVKEFTRSQLANNTVVRSQNSYADKSRTVPVQVWVHPLVKAELARIAERDGLSLSAAGGTRLSWLLVRVAFDAGQTRAIATNILGRQAGMNQDILKTILAESGKAAKANITRRTPQITDLINSVEKWIVSDDRGD